MEKVNNQYEVTYRSDHACRIIDGAILIHEIEQGYRETMFDVTPLHYSPEIIVLAQALLKRREATLSRGAISLTTL